MLNKIIESIKQKKLSRILFFLFITLCCYFLIILLFALIYFKTNTISFVSDDKNDTSINSDQVQIEFIDAFYFSYVSFHTIGFGDIHPNCKLGKYILLYESIISLFFTSIFSGLLVYFLLKRPNNLIISNNLFIRLKKSKFYLSCKVGNKGNEVFNVQCLLEAFHIINNIRSRFFSNNFHIGALEQTYHYDVNLTVLENHKLATELYNVVNENKFVMIRVTFYGFDSVSGDNVVISKTYKPESFQFGTSFKKTGDWDNNGNRINKDWSGFQLIENLNSQEIKDKFKDFIKSISL